MTVPTTSDSETAFVLSPSPSDEVVPDSERLWREIAIRCWKRSHPDREPGDGDIPTAAEVAECMGLTGRWLPAPPGVGSYPAGMI